MGLCPVGLVRGAQGHTVNLPCISLLPGMHSLLQYIVSIITLCCHNYRAIKSHFIYITEVINLHLAQCSLIVVKGNSDCNSDESLLMIGNSANEQGRTLEEVMGDCK